MRINTVLIFIGYGTGIPDVKNLWNTVQREMLGTVIAVVIVDGDISVGWRMRIKPGNLAGGFGSNTVEPTHFDDFGIPLPSVLKLERRRGGFRKLNWLVLNSRLSNLTHRPSIE